MSDLIVLVLRVLLAAACMVWHLLCCLRISTHAPGPGRLWRVLAWLPPITPFVGWTIGLRKTSVVWVLLAAGYLLVTVAAS